MAIEYADDGYGRLQISEVITRVEVHERNYLELEKSQLQDEISRAQSRIAEIDLLLDECDSLGIT